MYNIEEVSVEFLSEPLNNELYLKLIQQLNKDFQMTTIKEEFLLKTPPQLLIDQLQKSIKELIKRNYLEYLNLMYRIDVSENKLKNIDISNVNQIVYLILKREWQKVYIRNKL